MDKSYPLIPFEKDLNDLKHNREKIFDLINGLLHTTTIKINNVNHSTDEYYTTLNLLIRQLPSIVSVTYKNNEFSSETIFSVGLLIAVLSFLIDILSQANKSYESTEPGGISDNLNEWMNLETI